MNFKQERKDLMHVVMNGKFELLPILHQLTHYKDCDKFLKWLHLNNITGINLIEWLKINHNGSLMGMVKFIIKYQNKNREENPIILGRDWVK